MARRMWLAAFVLGTASRGCPQARSRSFGGADSIAKFRASLAAVPVPPALHSSAPVAVQLVNWPPHEGTFWIDVAKAALGAFIGAGLAFLSSYLQRALHERKENIAAGNLALFSIRTISRSMAEMRLSLRMDVSEQRAMDKNIPIWGLIRSWFYLPPEDIALDYESLTFLLDSEKGRDAMKQLRFAEEIYKEACHAYDLNQKSLDGYRSEFARCIGRNINADEVIDWDGLGDDIGHRIQVERQALFVAILYSVEVEIEEIKTAFDLMDAELKERFGSKAWDIGFFPAATNNRHVSRLPAYPDDIAAILEERSAVDAKVEFEERQAVAQMASNRNIK